MIGKLLFLRYDNFELVNLTENDCVNAYSPRFWSGLVQSNGCVRIC